MKDPNDAFPLHWHNARRLRCRLAEVVIDADAGWSETVGAVSHLLACCIDACDDHTFRIEATRKLTHMLMLTALEGIEGDGDDDAIGELMREEGLSFVDAVERLARERGMP